MADRGWRWWGRRLGNDLVHRGWYQVRNFGAIAPGTRLADVLQVCSTLVGDRPVNADDPGEVLIEPGSSVEFLPPFAGG